MKITGAYLTSGYLRIFQKSLYHAPIQLVIVIMQCFFLSVMKLKDWQHITCFLPVCRRWRLLAIKSWHRLNHLDFHGAFTSFKGIGGINFIKILDISKTPSLLQLWFILKWWHISRELTFISCCYDNQLLHLTGFALH